MKPQLQKLLSNEGRILAKMQNGWREWSGIGYNWRLALVCWLRLIAGLQGNYNESDNTKIA